MMKFILIFVFCMSSVQIRANATPYTDGSFRLLCLNTWMIPFLRRMANTRSRLIGKNSQDYDFVMLQEVFNRRQRGIITKEINREARFENRYQTTPLSRINSGLFNLSKYKIVSSSFKRFSRCGGAQCWSGKGVLHTRVRLPNNAELDIYNTHLQPFNSGESIRKTQMLEVLRLIEQTNDGKRAVILTGDFNVSASSNEYHLIINQLEEFGFFDAWTLVNNNDPGFSWDSTINIWAARMDNETTSQSRIDYIFVKNGSRDHIELIKSNIVFDEPLSLSENGRRYFLSDHFGVDIEFRISSN